MINEEANSNSNRAPIVVLLIINHILRLPQLAIESILLNSQSDLVIGYVSDEDLKDLPSNPRISFIDLSDFAVALNVARKNGQYQSFDENSFFKLVQLKWKLFREVMKRNPDRNLVYSDIDVFWVQDAAMMAELTFAEMKSVNLLVQNFTNNPSQPNLCMGFVALRNCPATLKLVDDCSALHSELLLENPRAGDDDVISLYYKNMGYPQEIYQLPQSTYPVGNLINLFRRRSLYPGLVPSTPYIYHSNFVVGVQRKFETAFLFYKNQNLPSSQFDFIQRVIIRFRIFIRFSLFYSRLAARKALSIVRNS